MEKKAYQMTTERTHVVELDKRKFDDPALSTYEIILRNRGQVEITDMLTLTPIDPVTEKFLHEQIESIFLKGEFDPFIFNLLSKYSPHATVVKCTLNTNVGLNIPPNIVVRFPQSITVEGFEAFNELQDNMRKINNKNEIYQDKAVFNCYDHIIVCHNEKKDKVYTVQTCDFIEDTLEEVSPEEFVIDVEKGYRTLKELQEHSSRLVNIRDLSTIGTYLDYYDNRAKMNMGFLIDQDKITKDEGKVLEETIAKLHRRIIRPPGTSFDAERYHPISNLHHGDPVWGSNILRDPAGRIHIIDPAIPYERGLGEPTIDSSRCRASALSILARRHAESLSYDKAVSKSLDWYLSTFSNPVFNLKELAFDFREIIGEVVYRDLTKIVNMNYWSIVNGLYYIVLADNPLEVQVNRRAIHDANELLKTQHNLDSLPELLTDETRKEWKIQ